MKQKTRRRDPKAYAISKIADINNPNEQEQPE